MDVLLVCVVHRRFVLVDMAFLVMSRRTKGLEIMKEIIKLKKSDGSEDIAESIDINMVSEHWSEAMLEDGTVIKLKPVFTKAYRVKDRYDNDGNPAYIIRSQNITAVTCPEALKKKSEDTK